MCNYNSESKRVPEKKLFSSNLFYYYPSANMKKKSDHKFVSLGLTECILLDNVVFCSLHVMKVAGISPFNHLKCINWCVILIAVRISSITLLYKLQNVTEKVIWPSCQRYETSTIWQASSWTANPWHKSLHTNRYIYISEHRKMTPKRQRIKLVRRIIPVYFTNYHTHMSKFFIHLYQSTCSIAETTNKDSNV